MRWIEVKKEAPLQDNCILVECIAEIRNNETGEIREYETFEVLEIGDEYPSFFNWEANDYSCDCNRLLFFKKAKKEVRTKDDWSAGCSNGKFSVNLKNKKDGEVYYREFISL